MACWWSVRAEAFWPQLTSCHPRGVFYSFPWGTDSKRSRRDLFETEVSQVVCWRRLRALDCWSFGVHRVLLGWGLQRVMRVEREREREAERKKKKFALEVKKNKWFNFQKGKSNVLSTGYLRRIKNDKKTEEQVCLSQNKKDTRQG